MTNTFGAFQNSHEKVDLTIHNRQFGNIRGWNGSLNITFGALPPKKRLKNGCKYQEGGGLKIGLTELPNNFRVVFVNDCFKQLLLSGKNVAGTWRNLSKVIKLDYTSIADMRNGSTKSVSLSVVKALASFAGVALQEIEKSCECVRRSNGKPIKIPVYTSPELASLVAHALADGSIGEKSTQVEYKNKRDECIQDVVDATKTVFSVEAQPTKDVSGFPMVVLPTAVGQVLVLAGAIQGNKTKKDFDVPPWILNGDSEIKRAFLRAMFDDEGSVDACCKWRSIKFAMGKSVSQSKSLYQFLNSIRNMLADFEINAQKVRVWRRYKVKDDDKLILGFWITGKQNSGKQNLKFFAQKIGFNHKIKQSKLTATLGTFKSIVHNKIPHDLDQDLKKKGR